MEKHAMPRCTVNVSSQSFVSDEQCRAVVCQRSRKAADGHRPSVLIPATGAGGDSERRLRAVDPASSYGQTIQKKGAQGQEGRYNHTVRQSKEEQVREGVQEGRYNHMVRQSKEYMT